MLAVAGMLMILAAACAGKKAVRGQKSNSSTNGPTYESVMIRRTTCFGRCPDYSIEIRKDGLVRYTGYRFTELTGIYERQMDVAKVQALLSECRQYRIDTCQAEYRVLASDLPGLNYTLQLSSGEKEIRHAHFGPKFLISIARHIDEELKPDASWKMVGELPSRD